MLTAWVIPVVVNKTTEIYFDWIKPYLRECWTAIFIVLSALYLFYPDVREVAVKSHKVVPEWLGYVICVVLGSAIFSTFWWFTGKALAPKASAPEPPPSAAAVGATQIPPASPSPQKTNRHQADQHQNATGGHNVQQQQQNSGGTNYQQTTTGANSPILNNPIIGGSGLTSVTTINSLSVELRVTCDLKEGAQIPPQEVDWLPIGGGTAELTGNAATVPLPFVSPVVFKRQANNEIVVINRFGLTPASDLHGRPVASLVGYKEVVMPLQTVVYAKNFERFRLIEASMTVNGKDVWYCQYKVNDRFAEEKGLVVRLPLDSLAEKVTQGMQP